MYNVLIADNDTAIRFAYRNMPEWKKNGFCVRAETSDGKNAYNLLKSNCFDIIFLDAVLPGIGGLELLAALENEDIHIPAVLVSTHRDFEYARKGMRHGAVDYLIKPFGQDELDHCLSILKKRLDKSHENDRLKRLFLDYGLNPDKPFVQKMIKYMNTRQPLSMSSMADYFGLNKDYFGKLFLRENGCSFQQFLVRYKMEYAKSLLLETDLKIYEVSEQLGYKTTDYFTRLFRKYTGLSPRSYRKNQGNIPNF